VSYILLIAGLAILLVTGDLLVRGSVGLAERLGVPALIIGLTIVAFGTSAPELFISVQAALADAPGIALGNVVGSNIANVLLVLGLPAIIASTTCSQPLVLRNTLFMIAATVIFIAMCLTGTLVWWHGAILFAMLVGFLLLSARRAQIYRTANGAGIDLDEVEGAQSLPIAVLLVVLGLAGLPFGAHLTIESARAIAENWGISEAAIGLTVVALGTSLPELAATLMAAIRKESAIAIGNIIGSNLFNILAVMGITALIIPVPVPDTLLHLDVWVMLACALVFLPYILARRSIGMVSGVIFVLGYGVYVAIVLSKGGLGGITG
jgi:cation:H+ antiporter